MALVLDHERFPDNVYAVVDGVTVARIVTVRYRDWTEYLVWQCPDAPKGYGIQRRDPFGTFNEAAQYVIRYVDRHPVKF